VKLLNFRVGSRESFGALGTEGVVDLGARLRGGAVPGVTDAVSMLRAGLLGEARAIMDTDPFDFPVGDVQILKPVGRGL